MKNLIDLAREANLLKFAIFYAVGAVVIVGATLLFVSNFKGDDNFEPIPQITIQPLQDTVALDRPLHIRRVMCNESGDDLAVLVFRSWQQRFEILPGGSIAIELPAHTCRDEEVVIPIGMALAAEGGKWQLLEFFFAYSEESGKAQVLIVLTRPITVQGEPDG